MTLVSLVIRLGLSPEATVWDRDTKMTASFSVMWFGLLLLGVGLAWNLFLVDLFNPLELCEPPDFDCNSDPFRFGAWFFVIVTVMIVGGLGAGHLASSTPARLSADRPPVPPGAPSTLSSAPSHQSERRTAGRGGRHAIDDPMTLHFETSEAPPMAFLMPESTRPWAGLSTLRPT